MSQAWKLQKIQAAQKSKLNSIYNVIFSVTKLDSVLLFVVKETVMADFIKNNTIDFQFLLEKVVVPFFLMRTRILKARTFFLIGDI
jgi:hypothetical protein